MVVDFAKYFNKKINERKVTCDFMPSLSKVKCEKIIIKIYIMVIELSGVQFGQKSYA